jgi:diketogulonate reductase-like aldo/keto reductase
MSKCWIDEVDDVEKACRDTLEKMGLDYLDLYMVHWPLCVKGFENVPEGENTAYCDPNYYRKVNLPMHKVWPQFESLVDKGLVKSIGISNFNVQMTWDLLSYCRIKPVINEVELHPLNVQEELVRFLKDHDIFPLGYCPVIRADDTSKSPNSLAIDVC